MQIGGSPCGDAGPGVHHDFHDSDDSGVVELDAGDFGTTDDHRQSNALKKRKVHVNVEGLSLEGGKSIGYRHEGVAHSGQVVQAFLEGEVLEVIGTQLVAKKGLKLLILSEEGVLQISPQHVVAVIETLQSRIEFSSQSFGHTLTEDFRDFVCRQRQQPQLTGSLEDLVDGKLSAEDKVSAVLYLTDGIESPQVHGGAFLAGKLGTQHRVSRLRMTMGLRRSEAS